MKSLNDPAFGLGLPVLRFNFRGAGFSEGTHDGEAEVSDVFAALDWLDREIRRPILLAGFSFGAAMALRACCSPRRSQDHRQQHPCIGALVALGLPTQIESPAYHHSILREITIPKLFLSGDNDRFSAPGQLNEIAAAAAEPTKLILLPGADHFFSGHLEPMQRAIASWVKEQLR
jgi:alpha/beta superfamily hydrolase